MPACRQKVLPARRTNRNTPPERYPLLLFYHPLNIYRKRVIKQADVVLAMFLLGDMFSLEEKERNFYFSRDERTLRQNRIPPSHLPN